MSVHGSIHRLGSTAGARSATLSLAAVLALVSCSRERYLTESQGETAEVVFALNEVPAAIHCVIVGVITDRTDPRRIDVTPGQSATAVLRRLPVGVVVFTADAFPSACAEVGEDDAPTWGGGPVSTRLQAGLNPMPVVIEMKPRGQVPVTVNFPPPPDRSCVAVDAPCALDSDCCSAVCKVLNGPSGSGVGSCQAPPVVGPSVTFAATGEKNYLIYPAPGEDACMRSGFPFAIEIPAGQQKCLAPSFGDVAAITVERQQLCFAGNGCGREACDDGMTCAVTGCLPAPPLEQITDDPSCPPTRRMGETGRTVRYLIVPRQEQHAIAKPAMGLPIALTSGAGDDATITPPAGTGFFVIAELGAPNVDAIPREMCDGRGLCGIVLYQPVPRTPVAGWSFQSSSSLSWSTLY
jgi:hypothetical protein